MPRRWLCRLVPCLLATGPHGLDAQPVSVHLPGDVAMDFARVPAGRYTVGRTDAHTEQLQRLLGGPFIADARAGAAHDVVLASDLYLARTEVTRAQWRSVMAEVPWDEDGAAPDEMPASGVSRAAADAWIGRLNDAAGDSLFRLPDDAEWEIAARAGSATLWHFGDDPAALADHAWHRGLTGPRPVATRRANAWGLHDMHGNVDEWTSDAWLGDGFYADCTGVTRGGHHAAGDGHGWLATLPFMRQPRTCGGDEDLSGVGLRLVYRDATATAVKSGTWGAVKVRIRGR